MAEEQAALPEGSAEEAKRKSKGLLAIVAACAVAGGGVGVFLVAPMLVGPPAAEAAGDHAPAPRRGGRGRPAGPMLYSVDNLVLNPNESNGTRFLMVSAAFEVATEEVLEEMRSRDAEIRDVLNRTLGERTVDELTDLSQRETLRDDLLATVEGLLHEGAILKVYLPQFVIQ